MLRFLRTTIVRLILGLLALRALSFLYELLLSCPHHHCSPSTQSSWNQSFLYEEDESSLFNFDDPPVSLYRPSIRYNPNPFFFRNLASWISPPIPILTVITVTRNPRPVFIDTASSILNQTLRSIRWLIINDHSDDVDAKHLLHTISVIDRRIVFQDSSREPGFCEGRLHALTYLQEHRTDFFAFLDDDDLLEPTFYEKCLLALHSVRNASACGSFVVGFGDRNYTWQHGFHSNTRIAVANPLTGSEVVRTSALNATSCTFDSRLNTGMEDWDFFLCLASHGHWGITVPEYLIWYRQNPIELRKKRWSALFERSNATASLLRNRYKDLRLKFPVVNLGFNYTARSMDSFLPFHNPLPVLAGIVVILPWIRPDREGEIFSHIITGLANKISHVTVITLLHGCQGFRSLRRVTSDIISAPTVSHASDVVHLLSYVIESRNPRAVVILHGLTGYTSLPILATRFRRTTFMDIILSNADNELQAISYEHARWLDASIMPTPSPFSFHSIREQRRASARDMLQLQKDDIVFVVVAHGGWMAHAETLLLAATEAANRIMENANVSTSISTQIPSERVVKMFVTTVDKGSSLALRKSALENHHSIVVLPFIGVAMLDLLIGASDIVCAAIAQGIIAVVGSNQLPTNALGDGILRLPPDAFTKNIDTLTMSLNKTLDAATLSSLMVQKADGIASREGLVDVANNSANSTHINRTDIEMIHGLVKAIQNTRTSLLRRLFLAKETNIIPHSYTHRLISGAHKLTDIAYIQQVLSGRTRGTFGEDYRYKCGEYNEAHTTLLDILESGVHCDGETFVDMDTMWKYALEQCGRWCVMDLSDQKRQSGWWIRESCGIEPFNDKGHKCTKWFKSISSQR